LLKERYQIFFTLHYTTFVNRNLVKNDAAAFAKNI